MEPRMSYWCCRNVHQHLPGTPSLLERRTSTTRVILDCHQWPTQKLKDNNWVPVLQTTYGIHMASMQHPALESVWFRNHPISTPHLEGPGKDVHGPSVGASIHFPGLQNLPLVALKTSRTLLYDYIIWYYMILCIFHTPSSQVELVWICMNM